MCDDVCQALNKNRWKIDELFYPFVKTFNWKNNFSLRFFSILRGLIILILFRAFNPEWFMLSNVNVTHDFMCTFALVERLRRTEWETENPSKERPTHIQATPTTTNKRSIYFRFTF